MLKHLTLKKYVSFFFLCLFAAGLSVGMAWAKPLQLTDSKATDCASCHKTDKALPESHPPVKDMDWKACAKCHDPKGKSALLGKLPASHVHALNGVTCAQCHNKEMAPPKIDKCVSCHGDTKKLAEKTKDIKPSNPHKSPHYGTDLECTYCHHQHEKTENYCNECHSFGFKVP